MPGRDAKRLSCRNRPMTPQRHDLGDRAPVNRDRQSLAAFDPTEHFAHHVAQVPNGNGIAGHVADCSICSHMCFVGAKGLEPLLEAV